MMPERPRRHTVTTDPQALARKLAGFALEKKGEDVVLLDLRELSTACDFFVLVSGQNDQHVKAISDHIEEKAAEEGARPWHVEGRTHKRWVLIDYVDVVVHVFHQEARGFYLLERLWGAAPREEIEDRAVPTSEER